MPRVTDISDYDNRETEAGAADKDGLQPMVIIKKGLDLPIGGTPDQTIDPGRAPRTAAVLGVDYPGLRPTMEVREGDVVRRGQVLFTDKKNPGVRFVAPVAGTVRQINRGAKRALQSVVIDAGEDAAESVPSFTQDSARSIERNRLIEILNQTGLFTAIRRRPFAKVPSLDAVPDALFVTAMDTNPLAADANVLIGEQSEAFALGVDVLARLTEGPVYVCHAPDTSLPAFTAGNVRAETFGGIHPAGLPGTHIHFLHPVSATRSVWYIGYQDVIAIANTLLAGELDSERVISLAGPGAQNPRLVRTRLGADLTELTAGELREGNQRVISGPILSGHTAEGPLGYLGRYHDQVSLLPEDRERRLFGYLTPGFERHSVFPIYLARWLNRSPVQFTTSTNGSTRGMVPIGTYESVMPLDILPTQLLRALLVGDLDAAIQLGALELSEDDVALCTYACPGKYEYGPVLRAVLDEIEKEG